MRGAAGTESRWTRHGLPMWSAMNDTPEKRWRVAIETQQRRYEAVVNIWKAVIELEPAAARWALRTVDEALAGESRPENRTNASLQNATSRLLAFMASNPGPHHIPELAEAVYGIDNETSRNRTRSLLVALQKKAKVVRVKRGMWAMHKSPREE